MDGATMVPGPWALTRARRPASALRQAHPSTRRRGGRGGGERRPRATHTTSPGQGLPHSRRRSCRPACGSGGALPRPRGPSTAPCPCLPDAPLGRRRASPRRSRRSTRGLRHRGPRWPSRPRGRLPPRPLRAFRRRSPLRSRLIVGAACGMSQRAPRSPACRSARSPPRGRAWRGGWRSGRRCSNSRVAGSGRGHRTAPSRVPSNEADQADFHAPKMHDIVEFLRRHAPFDALSEAELEELAKSAEVEFFAAGTTIFRQQEGPMEHVRMVRRGAVELRDRGRVLDLLREGELFGHPSMLSGLPTGFEARAGEDTLCYRLPADAVIPLLSRPAGVRYVARSLLARPWPDRTASAGDLDPAQQPVARLVHSKPVICDPSDAVREAARRMAEAQATAAVVRLPDGQLGVLTDHDLRDRVVAGGVGVDAPVTKVMSFPAFTVTPERLGAEVMLEMLDRNIRHVPVVWPHGEVLGVLSDRDLLAAETRAPFALRRAIDDADDVDGLRRVAGQLRPAVTALHDAEHPPVQIASIIAVVTDALTRRLMELAVGELGAPPCPVTWLALGSLGRREVVPSSDIDSALVWDGDDEEPEPYMRALGARVVDELAASGFAADPHGATAAGPLFDRSFDAWRELIRTSIE